MTTDRTDWRHVLPVSRFEMWVLRAVMMVAIFGSGFGAGLFYMQGSFERGLNYMQKAYVTPGFVERTVVTNIKGGR